MRTTSKLLGVVCAGWVALCMGAPHAGATTQDPSPVRWSSNEPIHQTYTPQQSSGFDLPLLGQWLDGINNQKDNRCDQCAHQQDKWTPPDNSCDRCNDGNQSYQHNGDNNQCDSCNGNSWDPGKQHGDRCNECDQKGRDSEHKDRCDKCDSGNQPPVIVVVKPIGDHPSNNCDPCDHKDNSWKQKDNRCDQCDQQQHKSDNCDPCEQHNGDTWNQGGDQWQPSGNQCSDRCDSWNQGDQGSWNQCDQSDCRQQNCDQSNCQQQDCRQQNCDQSDCHKQDCQQQDRCPDNCPQNDCPTGGPIGGMAIPVVGGLLG